MSTYSRRKAPYHHGELRPALLLAAKELLEDQGAAGIVLREVARRAGVSHNAPYRHFADRESLLAALAGEGFTALGRTLEEATSQGLGEAYVGFALEFPEHFRLMFGGGLRLDDYPALRYAAGQAHEALVSALRRRTDVADPEKAAAAAWALVHGLAHLLLDGHFAQATRGSADTRRFVKEVLAAVRFAAAPAQRSA
jgi:AcrR family transcriptional regulator